MALTLEAGRPEQSAVVHPLAQVALPLRVLVLHDSAGFPRPTCEGCVALNVQEALAETRPPIRYDAVIVTGHSTFDNYLGMSTGAFVHLLGNLLVQDPAFVVLDTCYGAQAELWRATLKAGMRPQVMVGAASRIPHGGFIYDGIALSSSDAAQQVLRIKCCGHRGGQLELPVTRMHSGDFELLSDGLEQLLPSQAPVCQYLDQLVATAPNLAAVQMSGIDGNLLLHIPAHRMEACFTLPERSRTSYFSIWIVLLIVNGLGLALGFPRNTMAKNMRRVQNVLLALIGSC